MKTKPLKMTIHEMELEKHVGSLPMVGWHNPYCTVEIDGQNWEMGIAGGCRKIYLKKPGAKSFYTVDIGYIVGCMEKVIK